MEKLVTNCGECPLIFEDRFYGATCILDGPYIDDPTIDIKNENEIAENCPLKKEPFSVKIANT